MKRSHGFLLLSSVALSVWMSCGCSSNAQQPASSDQAVPPAGDMPAATSEGTGTSESSPAADSAQPADSGRRVPPGVDPGKGCGGFLGDTCKADEYCAYEPGQHCGAADASATCKSRPQMCTKDYRPVCGCDNKTYGNACTANAAGQGLLSLGECPASQ